MVDKILCYLLFTWLEFFVCLQMEKPESKLQNPVDPVCQFLSMFILICLELKVCGNNVISILTSSHDLIPVSPHFSNCLSNALWSFGY